MTINAHNYCIITAQKVKR
ncbi:hypothetical protein [Pasteurella testudinis]